jgi:hypothetical protein
MKQMVSQTLQNQKTNEIDVREEQLTIRKGKEFVVHNKLREYL